ncbi:RICIN domain-containing protein [Saccharothrix deserti]|uniref:RICIN domain-containing protein n=1 Tax=Saccharothrix deserti TaxID=2593674 RepID=UPI00192E53BD|nr:RICIN domain-containing protein [Saccharothrix deserti]
MTSPFLARRTLSAALAIAMLALFFTGSSGSTPASAATQATYYVSPAGNDANPGTITSPFRTVQRARDVVRTVNTNMTGDIQVYLRGGNYPVTSTIEFTPADSGTNGNRVIYSAYPNETPVLNGGVQVTGWAQHSGNVWKAPLNRANKLRALYVNDKRAYMASKTINSAGCHGTYNITAGQADWAWESGSECDGAKYSLTDFPAVALNQGDLEIETATTWTTAITGVRQVTTSADGANRVALFQQPAGAIAQGTFNGDLQSGGSHKVMNAYEFLDTPGEFYFDKTSKTVYYYKADSDNMAAATVWAPNNVATVLKVAGTSTGNHVRNLTFSGITVEHSDWNLTEVAGSVFKQAQQGNLSTRAYAKKNFHDYFYRNVTPAPGIVQIENADGIVLERNKVQHTGVDGISLLNDVRDSRLIGNRTNDIAGSAITVGHPQHIYIGDHTATNGEKYPADVEGLIKNIEIKNNHIYDTAVLFNGHSPVSAYFVDSLTVQHNLIEKTPWSGVTLGWGWWNFDGSANSIVPNVPTTTARNNNISYNHFVDTVQKLHDTAPIYTLGSQPGTTIANNYIQGVPAGHKYGLHPDEGSAFINYQNNVLNIDPNVAYTINSGTWGRQHDLSITQTYGTINKIFDKNVPNSTIQDVLVYADNVWPSAAYRIAAESGLEEAYRNILPDNRSASPDHVLPASTFNDGGALSIPIRSTGDASRTIWLAPAGTTNFVVGSTMTKASGNATSIAVPESPGDYRLYVLDAQGNRSAESKSVVRQQWTHVDDKDARVTYSGSWSNWNDTQDFHGSENYTAQAGAYAEHTFTGSGVQYLGMKQPNMGKVDVYLDGALVQSDVDAYASTVTKQAVLFRKTDLSAGQHTIKVVCKGTKNAASTGTVCALDAFSSVSATFPVQGAYYKIVNRNSGMAVDVSGGSTSDGATVIQWGYNSADNQNWRFESASGGNFKIVSQKSGKLLDVLGASTADGASVVQWTDQNGANQHWQLVDAGSGYSKIRNVNSGKVLGVSGSSTAAGAQLVQVTDTSANSQLWQISRVS